MRFKEFLLEGSSEIGVVVQHANDPKLIDFWVFAWPKPSNTMAEYSKLVDRKFQNSTNDERMAFYAKLKKVKKGKKLEGEEAYGPFDDIKEII